MVGHRAQASHVLSPRCKTGTVSGRKVTISLCGFLTLFIVVSLQKNLQPFYRS